MAEVPTNRSIRIEESAVGSAIVSGDGNTIYVIHQSAEQWRESISDEPAVAIGSNPYKGLAAFQESDADRYFGREEQVQRLWERFQALVEQSDRADAVPRFLPILGPSGCGKSSLARAGLIPELARKPLPGKSRMRVAVLVPGTHPVEALAGVLAKVATQDPMPVTKTREFTTELNLRTTAGLYDGMRRIADLMPQINDSPLVVLVDQFEEVYSLCKDPNERQAFIENLLCAASDATGNLSVVITLRSDFLGETQRHSLLNQVIGSDQSVIVPAMTESELRRAIAEPAKQAEYPLDEATIDLLVKDTEGREGALPLLQFALAQIWEGLGDGKTPAATYKEMGGVGGALAGKAQAIYDQLPEAEQDMARRIFIGLVQLGEGTRDTRRRAAVKSLMASRDRPETLQQVLARFSSPVARLIALSSQGNQEIAEVTHEALFGHWQQLNNWLDSSRDDIRFKRRLEAAAQYWDGQGQPEGLLWRPPDLDLLQNFQQRAAQEMTQLETVFWQTSHRAEQRRKRNKQLVTAGLAIGLVLTTSSAGIAWRNARAANRSRLEAERNNLQTLAQTAATLTASGDNFEAGLVALAAGTLFLQNQLSNPATKNEIQGELIATQLVKGRELTRLEGHSDSVYEVRFSPDGQTLATASFDGTAKLWQADGTLITTLEGHSDRVGEVRFSPDGQTLATASGDGTAKLWQADGTLITTLEGHSDWVYEVRFSP
ncbi:MAG: AAA family ATPase, partial [Cyanobacteria bacterium P01_C01_bin.120]